MLGNFFKNIFYNVVYVQVRKNAFVVRNVNKRIERQFLSHQPFTTDRLLVGDQTNAQKTLFEALCSCDIGLLRPIIIIHPTEMIENGLSPVEKDILNKLALSAGARTVYIHLGHVLDDREAKAIATSKK